MILEFAEFTMRYGVWTALVLVLLRNRNLRRRLDKLLPHWARSESDVKEYVLNQKRIESKLDTLLEERGIVWRGTIETLKNTEARNLKRLRSIFSMVTLQKKLLLRRKKNMSKFKSRKFILAIVGAILIILNEGLDMGIDSETVLAFAGLLAVWISGESYVDGKRAEVTPNETDYTKADITGE